MSSPRCYPFLGKFRVSSAYGKRESVDTTNGNKSSSDHKGIDLVGIKDITVVSCSNGVVTKTGSDRYKGNWVWISTEDNYGTIYMHLQYYSVKVGDKVTVKQKIGVMGKTGNVTGPHLHFGVATNSEYAKGGYSRNSWINPAIWFGIDNYNAKSIVGKTFDGSGMIFYGYAGAHGAYKSERHDELQKQLEETKTTTSYETTTTYKLKDLSGVYRDYLYGRRYRIIIALDNNDALDVSDLRCIFSIKKTSYKEPQQSILTIYNLNPDDENKIIKSGQRFIIEAGYNGTFYGKIFEGNIIQPVREKENGTDYKLTLVSMDAERYINYGIIGCSLVANQSSRDAINALSERSTVKCELDNITDTKIKYPRGKVLFGKASDYLNQIAKSENATFYIENEKINIVKVGQLASDEIFDLDPTSGLIGTPEQYEYGITFSCLLNPMIGLHTRVHIDNKKIKNLQYSYGNPVRSLDKEGIYQVISLEYMGDTRGRSWLVKANAITQTGELPAMAVGSDLFVFG